MNANARNRKSYAKKTESGLVRRGFWIKPSWQKKIAKFINTLK